jgi:hypothetical protein
VLHGLCPNGLATTGLTIMAPVIRPVPCALPASEGWA